MARRWTSEEEGVYRKELHTLYVTQNRTISEVARHLGISEKTVFQRLGRLNIPTAPSRKSRYRNRRQDVSVPPPSATLAEFIGILLGDGSISHFQTKVTLGSKEYSYVQYVQQLMTKLFRAQATIFQKNTGHYEVYLGSTQITTWLLAMGLARNKVAAQVDVPPWIMARRELEKACLRGFFDTDGGIYALRFGVQISFKNRSLPLLWSLRSALLRLGYTPSAVSGKAVYLTRREDVDRFFTEIRPANPKHVERYTAFRKA